MFLSLLILTSVLCLVYSYSPNTCLNSRLGLRGHVLNARTHKNYLYGDAIDSLKRRNPYQKQLDEKLDSMGIDDEDLDSQQDALKSGEDFLKEASN